MFFFLVGITLLISLLVGLGNAGAAAWVTMVTVLGLVFAEHKTGIGKTPVVLVGFGAMLFISLASGLDYKSPEVKLHMNAVLAVHFGIVLFLKAAMQQIKVLDHYSAFDLVQQRILKLGLRDKHQVIVVLVLAAVSSAVVDNMTSAMIFGTIATLFFSGPVLLMVQGSVVAMANIGGVPSVIGDITTVMLWMAGKLSAPQALLHAGLPSLVMAFIVLVWTYRVIRKEPTESTDAETEYKEMVWSEHVVVWVTLSTFFLPIGFNLIFEKPEWGLVVGMGISWALVECLKKYLPMHTTHLEADIEEKISKLVDNSSIMFFVGILGCVAVLEWMHQLDALMHGISGTMVYIGVTNPYHQAVVMCLVLGWLSAFLDNIPLVAIAIPMMNVTDPAIWALLALTAGTGGSMLITGSAAGVVMMKNNKDLTSSTYLKKCGLMNLVAYHAGFAVWCIQHWRLLIG